MLASCFAPPRFIVSDEAPEEPDYSQEKHWLALPHKKDSADLTVRNSREKDRQEHARVDVFYVHPTTYILGNRWNGDLNDTVLMKDTDGHVSRHQASIFNESCRIYAPRYRLGNLFSYVASKKRKQQVFDLAYEDVRKAFQYYLQVYNKDRPFIIASHSQGTEHAMRLCRDLIEKDTMLRERMVAAYLVGTIVQADYFQYLRPCENATQTNCFVSWNTVKWGEREFFGKPVTNAVCVNPLTWRPDLGYAGNELNLGAVPEEFDRIDTALVDARCSEDGLLWIHPPEKHVRDYPRGFSFHRADYNLFYMNIRENLKVRVRSYFNETAGREIKR